jgi:DNA-directed RNA polymerase subunit beta'
MKHVANPEETRHLLHGVANEAARKALQALHPGVAAAGQQLLEDYNLDGVELVMPTTVFDTRYELDLDGTEVHLIYVGPCHPVGATVIHVPKERVVFAGAVLAKIPRAPPKTKDITGGLPRVVELFEARRPHETAVISEINGVVRFGELAKGMRKVHVVGDDGQQREYLIPRSVHISVQEGERVKAGDPLMDGPRNPHDILHVLGEKELQKYMVNEVQEVYRLQGVTINDKHLEVIVRQMMRWVKVEEIGDTEFLPEEVVDKFRFREENQRVIESGGRPAEGKAVLLGITKASLSTDSFISAASFQETTRVLTEAAINGKIDHLRGLKENVIMGRLIPAGTGMEYYRRVKIAGEDIVEEEPAAEPEIAMLDAIPGYEEETRLQYGGGLSEVGGEEPLGE